MTHDIIIVGAGPAGLTAALYAARFCRSTLVIHDGTPRAATIPLSHNVPGHENGIGGPDLLERMARHATAYGATIVEARVTGAARADDLFILTEASGRVRKARAVILATGAAMNRIPIPEEVHQAAIDAGVLRYCPVCDGFEHRGERIAVLGCDVSGAAEALFLAGYSDDITLVPRRDVALDASERRDLEAAGIHILTAPVVRYEPAERQMLLHCEGRAVPFTFDVLYPALGLRPRSDLARQLGLSLQETGSVAESAPFATEVPGLYCAGDLVEGLDQISVAMGHGAVAATRAHNWLRARAGETAEAVLGDGEGALSR